ncbi:hypothetical protein [Streptomyces acidiscabies]|uniref:hypothetical protein n=1 Tax=Streptomyces acidiscabies TaxID=42234 RepID=UPI0038F607FC
MGTQAVAAPQVPGVSAVDVVIMAAPPSCVSITRTTQDEGYKTFKVKNNCTSTQNLKGIFKYGYDSSCTAVPPGQTRLLSSIQPWVDYDKVVTC